MGARGGEGRAGRRCRDARSRRSDLELRVKRYGPHIRVLAVAGCLSCDHADRFCSAVREQLVLVPRLLVLETTGVAAVDSAGVRALVHAARLAGEAGIRLAVVTGTSTAVATAVSVNGLSELFEVHPGTDHAISELA